jgi:HAD superfamily hydrolase (TIGR01549 family)
MAKIAAIVPLKLSSRRLPNKNFLRLGDRPLAYHVFETLLKLDQVGTVYCYTSQSQILSLLPDQVELLMRPERLDGDDVRANELFRYAVSAVSADTIILSHATAPFISAEAINEGLAAVLSGEYDSAFAVRRLQTYCWMDGKPLNYDPTDMAQTQALSPLVYETSGFYIFHKRQYLDTDTRIGTSPRFVEVDVKEAIDIDTPEDFALATNLLNYFPADLAYSRDTFFVDLANQGIPLHNIEHVAFDLDGVLVDSLTVMQQAWDACSKQHKLSQNFDAYRQHIGLPFDTILKHLGLPVHSFAAIKATYDSYSTKHVHDIRPFSHALDAVERLRDAGVKVSVVTSKTRGRAEHIVRSHFGDNVFGAIVCPEDVAEGRGKPSPDSLLLSCLRVGADPHNTIYVGDMEGDLEAARRAGVHFVYAAWGYGELKRVRDIWFNDIADLASYILGD